MDELDRILREDDEIVPSPAFVSRVMAAVRTEAAAPPPIPLPWGRLLIAPVLSVVLVVVTAVSSPDEAHAVVSSALAPLSWCAERVVAAGALLAPMRPALWTLLGSLLVAFLLWPLAVPPLRLRRLP